MYKIVSGNNIIYDSSDKVTYPAIDPSLHLGVNDAGSCKFTILPTHPYYQSISKLRTFVKFYEDDEELFYGRVLNTEKGLDDQLSVSCEGAFTFFLDSDLAKETRTETIHDFIAYCIQKHNEQVEVEKQFTLGEVTADKAVEIDPKTGSTIQIKFEIQDYANIKSVLESLIIGKYGGFFRIRPNPNGPHFLDYVQTYGRVNTQSIKIGENVIDRSDNVSGQNIFTILRPIGKDNLTIADVPDTEITLENVEKSGEKLFLTDKISEYGQILKTERFGDIDDASLLLKAAEEFIARNGMDLPATLSITAVDWHHLNPNAMPLRLGDVFTAIEDYIGINLTLADIELNPDDITDSKYEFKNDAEIAANDPASGSGGLSASYASRCTHIDYVYKYIHEGDNELLLHTDAIRITAEKELQLSSILTNITAGQMYLVANVEEIEDPDNPGHTKKVPGAIHMIARGRDESGDIYTDVAVDMNNLSVNNGNLVVDGYVQARELVALEARIAALESDYAHITDELDTNVLDANIAYIGALEVGGNPIGGAGRQQVVTGISTSSFNVFDVTGTPVTIRGVNTVYSDTLNYVQSGGS